MKKNKNPNLEMLSLVLCLLIALASAQVPPPAPLPPTPHVDDHAYFEGTVVVFNSTGGFQMESTVLQHRNMGNGQLSAETYTVNDGKCVKGSGKGVLTGGDHGVWSYSLVMTGPVWSVKERGMAYLRGEAMSVVGSGTTVAGGTSFAHSTVGGFEHGRVVSTNTLVSQTGAISLLVISDMHPIEAWNFEDLVRALNCQ